MEWEFCFITQRFYRDGNPIGELVLTFLSRPAKDSHEMVTDLPGTIAALQEQGWVRKKTTPVYAGREDTGKRKLYENTWFRRPAQAPDQR